MSTSLHAVFDVIFGSVYFVIVIFNICGRKCDFLKVVKIPYPKNQIFVTLRSFSQHINFFQGMGENFLLVHLRRSNLTKK